MDKKVIWQPEGIYQPGHDFGVLLDRVFAIEMGNSEVFPSTQRRMNDQGDEIITELGHSWSNPYDFYKDSFLVTQFNLGGNGVRLALDRPVSHYLSKPKENDDPVKYCSHNVDTSSQAYALMALFDMWVQYSNAALGKD